MVAKRAGDSRDSKNIYKSRRSHIDRNARSSLFPAFHVKIERISTALLLFESDESDIVEEALYHIDKFASMGNHQLYALHEKCAYDSALKLIKSENAIVRKFAFKLLVQLAHTVDDCRRKVLSEARLIEETKEIFMTSSDENLVEFSCILLHYICDDVKHTHALASNETFVRAVFARFTSPDPDILLQSMRLLNLIMRNSMLIGGVLSTNEFPLKNLQIELKNDCRDIRVAALESFQIISALRENPLAAELFSDRLLEALHGMCMEDEELRKMALVVLGNMCRDESVAVKVSQFLPHYLRLTLTEEALQLLASLAVFEDNARVMRENGLIREIMRMLRESGSLAACDALLVLAKSVDSLDKMLSENVLEVLLQSLNEATGEKVLTTLHALVSLQGLNQLMEAAPTFAHTLAAILKNSSSVTLKLKAIGILEKLSTYPRLRERIAQFSEVTTEIFFCLIYSNYCTKLIVRLFQLIACFIDQKSFRDAFIEFKMSDLIIIYLPSQVDRIKSSVCTLIGLASHYAELAAHLIEGGVLATLLECDFSCSPCSDSLESLLDTDVALKFSLRRRLGAGDRIKSGFYAAKCDKLAWTTLRTMMKTDLQSPMHPIYAINFEDECVTGDCRKMQRDGNLRELKRSLCEDEHFEVGDTKRKVKILAKKVANFFEHDSELGCDKHHLTVHLSELKFKVQSLVLPLGSLIYGGSFESALLFKALADQVNLDVSFVTDAGGRAWNEINDSGGIVDLFFIIGEIYDAHSCAGRKYLQSIP